MINICAAEFKRKCVIVGYAAPEHLYYIQHGLFGDLLDDLESDIKFAARRENYQVGRDSVRLQAKT